MPFNAAKLAVTLLLTADIKGFEGKMQRLERSMKGSLARMNKFGHNMEKTGVNMKKAGLTNVMTGAAYMAPLAFLTKKAVDLESATADIAKVLPTTVAVGSAGFLNLEKSAMKVGAALGRSAEDSAGLMASLAAGGVAQKDLERTALLAGKIGVAFDVTGLEAGQSFQAIRNAMQLNEQQAMQVMNANNALANSYGSTIDASARLMKFMTDTGASVAASLHTTGGEMESFANSFMTIGIDSETAGTSIARFSKAILTNSKLASIFNKSGGGMKGVVAILDQAKESGNAVQWLLQHGVGQYSTQIGAVVNSMNSNKGLKAQLAFVSDKKNVEGSVAQEFGAKASTRAFQLNQLKTSATNLAITLGNSLVPALSDLLKRLQPIISRVTKWIDKNPKLVKNILLAVAAMASLRLGLGALQLIFGSMIGIIGKLIVSATRIIQVIPMIGKAFSVVSKLFMANPWLIAIMAIAAGVYLIIKNWDKIKAFFIKLWDWVKKTFFKAWDFIKGLFLKYTIPGMIISNWSKIADFFSSLWSGIKDKFMGFVNFFKSKWDWIKNNVIDPVGKFLGFSGGSNLNVTNKSITGTVPAIVPHRNNTTNNTTSMNFTLTGSATKQDADLIVKTIKKHMPGLMGDYNHNKNRISFGY